MTIEKLYNELMNERNFKITPSGAIKQNERNPLKQEILATLVMLISDNAPDLVIERTGDGYIMEFLSNGGDKEISIPVQLDIKIKNTKYDVMAQHQAYLVELDEKEKEKIEKQKAKEKKIARDKEIRKQKQKLKELQLKEDNE